VRYGLYRSSYRPAAAAAPCAPPPARPAHPWPGRGPRAV